MSPSRRLAIALAALAVVAAAFAAGSVSSPTRPAVAQMPADDVRLNEIQVIGSHNSYHVVPDPDEEALRRAVLGSAADLMQYTHRPLPVQFASQKVRQIELDVFVDRAGGKYATPLLRDVAGKGAYQPEVMNQPGLKVLHIQDVDYVSTCVTLDLCLRQIKTWSDANPSHVPIAVLLELKDTPLNFPGFEFVQPDPFDAAAMDEVDSTIRAVFPDDRLITPDDVRGSHATLNEAVLAGDAWPTLGESRGKVMFLMDNGGGYRSTYLAGHPNLAGRVLFTNAPAGAADAAFVKMNDPFETTEIQDLVRAGYVVRTRADGDTTEARNNDTRARDAALASGAQWVSTDYPVPGLAVGFTSPYVAEIPGGTVARCNPINGPEGCVSAELDTIFDPEVLPPPTTPPSPPPTSAKTPTSPGTGAPGATGARPVAGRPAYTG